MTVKPRPNKMFNVSNCWHLLIQFDHLDDAVKKPKGVYIFTNSCLLSVAASFLMSRM